MIGFKLSNILFMALGGIVVELVRLIFALAIWPVRLVLKIVTEVLSFIGLCVVSLMQAIGMLLGFGPKTRYFVRDEEALDVINPSLLPVTANGPRLNHYKTAGEMIAARSIDPRLLAAVRQKHQRAVFVHTFKNEIVAR